MLNGPGGPPSCRDWDFSLSGPAWEQGVGSITGHLIPCKGSDEQLGQDLGQVPAPSRSGRAEGSIQETGLTAALCWQRCGGKGGTTGWLEELGEPVEQWEQPGLSALSTKGWSRFWETFKSSSENGYRSFPAWAPVFSSSGDQGINSRSVVQAGICWDIFLSWNQQCSLQWFAAVLFLAPQGRDTYCFSKSF